MKRVVITDTGKVAAQSTDIFPRALPLTMAFMERN
jgi:hypothetical protein